MNSKTNYHIFINAEPASVFSYISNLTLHSEWSGAPLKVEALDPAAIVVGKRYRSVGDDPFSQNVENQLTVTELQPSARFCFTAVDPRMGADAQAHPFLHEFILTPKNGGTLLERNVIRNMPFIQHLLTKYVMGALVARPLMNRALTALKQKLEGKK
jgi:uncharacterized protein YndB with AHSA1/START domain